MKPIQRYTCNRLAFIAQRMLRQRGLKPTPVHHATSGTAYVYISTYTLRFSNHEHTPCEHREELVIDTFVHYHKPERRLVRNLNTMQAGGYTHDSRIH